MVAVVADSATNTWAVEDSVAAAVAVVVVECDSSCRLCSKRQRMPMRDRWLVELLLLLLVGTRRFC